MKADFVVWIGCVLIFGAGVLWSPIVVNTSFGEFGYSILKAILECASYVATVIAACFAVLALNAWRAQFKHAERFRALSELSETAVGLSIIGDYIYTVTASRMNDRLSKSSVGARKDASDAYHDEWWSTFRKFLTVLDKTSIFLEDIEFSELNLRLKKIESSQRGWVSKFYSRLQHFDASQNDEMVEFVEEWRLSMLDQVEELRGYIRDIRKATIR